MKIITYCEECFDDLMDECSGEIEFYKTLVEFYIHNDYCPKFIDHQSNKNTCELVEFLESIGLITTTEFNRSVGSIRPNGVNRLVIPDYMKSSHSPDVYEICFDESHANIFELEENRKEE
jgi:hypothetical protein